MRSWQPSVKGAWGWSVYRAHDEELGEDVAIKTLRPELVIDPVSVEPFKRETLLARKITHRNVVRTHDFGQWQNVYFLTMEYVEGITVRTLIDQRGHLNPSATLAIARQLVDSIAAAHDVGVIHRDIKPQNLLLDEEGVLKVMDFGVARLAERTSDLTEAGLTLGNAQLHASRTAPQETRSTGVAISMRWASSFMSASPATCRSRPSPSSP